MNKKVQSEEKEETVSPNLKLVIGGKDTEDPNWLKALPENSVFSTRPKFDGYGKANLSEGLAILQIIAKTEKAARLFDTINRKEFMVDMSRFSRLMEKFEVYGEVNYREGIDE